MMHDIAITENYVIILDHPLVFEPMSMLTQNRIPFVWQPSLGSRYGVLKRSEVGLNKPDAVKWFECKSHFVFHVVNSWEQKNGEIVILVCRYDYFDLEMFGEKRTSDKKKLVRPRLSRIRLNMETGGVMEEDDIVKDRPEVLVEFPTVRPSLVGRFSKFGYFARVDPECEETGKIPGCVKIDLETGEVCGKINFDGSGGECVFVPRDGSRGEEDDGYLLTYLTKDDPTAGGERRSRFAVFDAKTMSPTPVCQTKLKSFVPYGFHTLFVNKAEKLAIQEKQKQLKGNC
eukprot:Selendium_serpulae@DN5581_c1_g1_i3.p1